MLAKVMLDICARDAPTNRILDHIDVTTPQWRSSLQFRPLGAPDGFELTVIFRTQTNVCYPGLASEKPAVHGPGA